MLKVKVLEKIFGKCVELLDSFNVYLRSVILKGFLYSARILGWRSSL